MKSVSIKAGKFQINSRCHSGAAGVRLFGASVVGGHALVECRPGGVCRPGIALAGLVKDGSVDRPSRRLASSRNRRRSYRVQADWKAHNAIGMPPPARARTH